MASPPRLVKTRQLDQSPTRGIVSSRKSGQRVIAQSFEPPEDLQHVVERFWLGEWDLPDEEPHTTLLLSDPCVHLVVEEGLRGREARVVGVWTQLWERKLEGRGQVRGVKFHPGAASTLLPTPIEQWTDKLTPLDEIVEEDAVEMLMSAVLTAKTPEEAFSHFAAFVRGRVQLDPEIVRLRDIVAFVRTHQELTRVESLAEHFGMTARALQRLFKEKVGASPKWLIRRNRLQEVATRIEAGNTVSFALLAAELGYTDQAHLAREFKNAVGKSPREFAEQCRNDG